MVKTRGEVLMPNSHGGNGLSLLLIIVRSVNVLENTKRETFLALQIMNGF
jgi:hypothetical protein